MAEVEVEVGFAEAGQGADSSARVAVVEPSAGYPGEGNVLDDGGIGRRCGACLMGGGAEQLVRAHKSRAAKSRAALPD